MLFGLQWRLVARSLYTHCLKLFYSLFQVKAKKERHLHTQAELAAMMDDDGAIKCPVEVRSQSDCKALFWVDLMS